MRVMNVKVGDILTLSYELVCSEQIVNVQFDKQNPLTYTIKWVGNCVTKVLSDYETLDLFVEERGLPDRKPVYKEN